MKKFLLITIFFMSQLYALQFCYEEAGWCYDVSTFQAFYLFHSDNAALEYVDGSGVIENGDAIGAFKKDGNGNDVCVGFLRIGSENQPDANGIITLATMGNDGSFPDYLAADEVPFLKLYDASTGKEVCVTVSGAVLPGWQNNGIFNHHGLIDAYGDPYPESYLTGDDQDCDTCIFGEDNDDLTPAEDPCDCQGVSEYCDCNNVPLNGFCDCDGNVNDCGGICGGNASEDCFGICNGDAVEDCLDQCGGNADEDCSGECDGNAFNNDCGCVGGNTGLEIDCCEVCGDIYAVNYSNVGLCDGEEIYNDSNNNGQVDPGEQYSNASLCIPGNVEGLSAQQSGTNDDGLIVGGSIELNWDIIQGDIAEYEIQRTDENDIQSSLFASNSDGLYIDNNLLPSSFYTYKIRAIHDGDSTSLEWSNEVTQQTLGLLTPQIISVDEGEERLSIGLSMPGNITTYNQGNYSYRLYRTCGIDDNDCGITEINTSSLYPNDVNVEPDVQYCYTAKAIFDNTYLSDESNQVCGTPNAPSGWTVTVEATVLGLGVFEETDLENYFGMHPDASDGFDAAAVDIPEPPPNPGNFIQLYFPHDDCVEDSHGHDQWQSPYSDFTQDIRFQRKLSDNLETWKANILSNMDGPVELKFIFDDWGVSITDDKPPINFPIYVLRDGIYELVEMPRCLGVDGAVDNEGDECLENMDQESCTGNCDWLEDTCVDIEIDDPTPEQPGNGDEVIVSMRFYEDLNGDGDHDTNEDLPDNKLECESHLEEYTWFGNNIIEYNSNAYEYEYIDIIAGNIPPQTPTGVNATSYSPEDDPAAAWITLSWDETEECCQTIESRYPATHYYIYRMLTQDSDIPGEDPILTPQLIDNCNTPNGDDDDLGPVIGTWHGEDSNGDGQCNYLDDDCRVIDADYCKEYRQLFKGIVPADQFHFVDSTLDLRALGFLDKLIDMPEVCEGNDNDAVDCIESELVAQWRFENARHIFETEFKYVITAVNENFPNADGSDLSSFVQGTESDFSIETSAITRTNLNPITMAGNDQYLTVKHDGYHQSMENFEDTGIDGQPNTNDFLDYGNDGILSMNEPGYDPINNPDPNGDDYNLENLDGTEGNLIFDEGEPGEGDGKFTFLDYGGDRTPSFNEDGYDPGTCSDDSYATESLCLQNVGLGAWTQNLDPNDDDWDPDTNPTGTEGNFIHDEFEYSEQFNDTGCPGCDEPFIDDNGNGVYDDGELFTDCSNGICDGDPGWDPDDMGNGIWDSSADNGVWDGNRDFITVFLDGSQSSDPEYGSGENALDFVWQQVSGPNVFLNTLLDAEEFIDSNGNDVWDEGEDILNNVDGLPQDYYFGGKVEPIFNAVVPYGTEPEVYEFNLVAEDTYFKGWPPEPESHQFPENVSITVFPEQNEAPSAMIEAFIPGNNDLNNYDEDECEELGGNWNPVTFECSNLDAILCRGNWECDYSVYEYDENFQVIFDYSDEENILGPTWRIPHDGDPYTNLAVVGIIGEDSKDNKVPDDDGEELQADFDEIFYDWFTDNSPEPYNDIGTPPNGQYDPEETFFDLNNNGIWDDGDPYSGKNIIINRSAKQHAISLEVNDVYGSTDQVDIDIKVLPEVNQSPFAEAGSNQTWYLDEFAATHVVKLPFSNLLFNENGNNEWTPGNEFRQINLSYDLDTLGLFDCGLDGLCDEDEPGFMFYGPDGDFDSGDEIFDPSGDGCTNPDFYDFYDSDCALTGTEANGIWDEQGEYIDYDHNGIYTDDLGDGIGENYYRDELSYAWYLDLDDDPYAIGDTVTLNLEPGEYTFYLEVCDPYDGYAHEDFDPFTNQWEQTEYVGCSIDSVNISILDEEAPSKPEWVAFPGESLTRSLYYMDLDWDYNIESDCIGRTDFTEECKPGFVDKYKIYRNGLLINTYDAWVDGNPDGMFQLDNNSDDSFIDCQYVCVDESDYDNGNVSFNIVPSDVCKSNIDCDSDEICVIVDESCQEICEFENCYDKNSYVGNNDFWSYNPDGSSAMGNGWYDPPEALIDEFDSQKGGNCSGTFEGDEEYDDLNNNEKWDPAEDFSDCNEDFTICDYDDAWESIQDSVDSKFEYNLGEPFVDTNGNGVWDDAEEFTDSPRPMCNPLSNGEPFRNEDGSLLDTLNGVYDFADSFEDWNDNGRWDSGDIFFSGEIYSWLDDAILNQWDPGRDGYSEDYIKSYPNFRDDGDLGTGLIPNTEYCYFIVAVNSSGVSSYPSDTKCAYTALLPTINIITPNGAEIYTKGVPFDVEWDISDGNYLEDNGLGVVDTVQGEENISYIDRISIEYRIGNYNYPSNGDNEIWYTNDYRNLDEENTAKISIYDLEDIEPNNVELRITITDVGGFTLGNTFEDLPEYQFYSDVSDDKFTLSTTRLSYSFPAEWSLFGSPLDLSDPINSDLSGNLIGNGMIDNLGTDQNLGDFGTSWYVYNENGEFPANEFDDFELEHGRGYILTLNETSAVTLNGGVVNYAKPGVVQDNATLQLQDGWNLISNMLVSEINKENLVVKTFNQFYSWVDAVNFGFVQSELHGWNNEAKTYESINQVMPWEGYWIHASRDLELIFSPHVPNQLVQRENRGDIWALNIRARGISNGSSGDYIAVGLSDSASADFRYGEDEYDTPIPLGDKYVDLFFDRQDWVGGLPDINGNEVTETEFIRDVRPYSILNEPNYWHVSSFTYADEGVDGVVAWNDEDEVELSWNNFDAIIGLADSVDIFLHIDDDYYDMKIEESVIVTNITDREITIQIGGDSPLAYDSVGLPTHFTVSTAYPNPFNPISNLDYAIPNSGNVNITVYNINGQLVETLVDEYKSAGYYSIAWDAFNISSGIYFIKVESGQNVSTQKLMLMK